MYDPYAATFTLHVLKQGGFAASTSARHQQGAAQPKKRMVEAELRSIEKQLQIVKESKLAHEEEYRLTHNPQLLVIIRRFDDELADLEQRQRDLES